MSSIVSELLFSPNRSLGREASSFTPFARSSADGSAITGQAGGCGSIVRSRIHVGPATRCGLDEEKKALGKSDSGESIPRLNVVKDDDAHRGFRLFDGTLMSVRDVSSEELFLERMRIAYSAYEAYVASLVSRSPMEITRGLVRAVSACLVRYFSTQSVLRTNRPFIAKVLNLDRSDMFCSNSDFVQAFLFTNASPEDEQVISLAEKVYGEKDFDVCADFTTEPDNNRKDAACRPTSTADRLFELGMRLAEQRVLGGTHASTRYWRDATERPSDLTRLSDDLPFQQRKDGTGRTLSGGTSAMLIVVTDFEALHNYVAYTLYLTPVQLSRRYNVDFDCLRRSSNVWSGGEDCARARRNNKRKRDEAKTAIRAVIERKQREKLDGSTEKSGACNELLQQHAARTTHRNGELLRHVLLLLFDKCLSGVIDKGFENLNASRGYAVNSAKEIGSATVYTGIIDTVGEVSTRIQGYTFDSVLRVAETDGGREDLPNASGQARVNFSLPLGDILTEVTTGNASS